MISSWAMAQFKVLTLNIHKGFSTTNWKFTLTQIRESLRESQSNIVFLQEVVGDNALHREAINDWPENNQLEFLADSVWDHFAYGKNSIYDHGHHGNAILSEVPFSHLNKVNVSSYKFSQRGILHGQLENGIHLLCVHFGLFEQERVAQTNILINYVRDTISEGEPILIAGDFNDWKRTSHKKLVKELNVIEAFEITTGELAKSFPTMLPVLQVDRIYSRGFSIQRSELLLGNSWRNISDHCALSAEMNLLKSSTDVYIQDDQLS